MQITVRDIISSLVICSAMVVAVSCDSSYTDAPPPGTVTGRVAVGTATLNGTILAIDPAAHRVTIACDDGVTRTFVVNPEVGNLENIKPNDHITATIVKKLAVFVSKANNGPGVAAGTAMVKATDGSQGGLVMADMREMTARVVAVDQRGRSLRLEDASGEVHDWDVQPDVDLAAIKPGDDIVARYTEAIAVLVENGQ